MIGYEILYNSLKPLLNKKIVNKVYHSVFMYQDTDDPSSKYPVYRIGDEMFYVGVDDNNIMNAYVRQVGSLDANKIENIGACGKKAYKTKTLFRAVFFNDFETRNHDDLVLQLLTFTFQPGIELSKVITDKNYIKKEESYIKNFNFGGNTFYIAVDFYIHLSLKENCFDEINCSSNPNPICI